MTKESAVEVKTHLELALAQLLHARCLTPNDDEIYKHISEAHETSHAVYFALCAAYRMDWKTKNQIARNGQPFVAIVSQPGCANVFHVTGSGKKTRLAQGARDYCAAFAAGFLRADSIGDGFCSKYRCGAGDAAVLQWEPEIDE